MTCLRFIQSDTERLLFDQDMGLRNIHINALGVAISTDDLLLKVHTVRDMIGAENILKNINPVGAGILVLAAFPVPFVIKLSGSFPLLSIRHEWSPSIFRIIGFYHRISGVTILQKAKSRKPYFNKSSGFRFTSSAILLSLQHFSRFRQ